MTLFAFLIGLFAGLRSLTPPAAVAWAVHLGWIKLARPLSLIGSFPAVIILSLLAITELIFDKLPNTPNRTALPGLITRMVTGGLTGACVSLGDGQSAFVGEFGLIGGVVGCFAGYHARAWLVGPCASQILPLLCSKTWLRSAAVCSSFRDSNAGVSAMGVVPFQKTSLAQKQAVVGSYTENCN
jgi:uncharacterized membrane protein